MKCFIAPVFCLITMVCQSQAAILLESSDGVIVPGPATMPTACALTVQVYRHVLGLN